MEMQDIVFSHNVCDDLDKKLASAGYDKLFILTDENTSRLCYGRLSGCRTAAEACRIVIPASDVHKNIESLTQVWDELSRNGATRKSLLINLGGGMVTDLGGFAASTFKRGIRFINIPTTLLAMVDASVGGKTGINFAGLKNEIGVFSNALTVVIDTAFLTSLDSGNMKSGYAEMVKHGLISTVSHWAQLMDFDISRPDMTRLQELVRMSIEVKQQVVIQDPTEKALRKALNFGHTLGHAFESLALEKHRPALHGYAVAWGMIGELYMSHVRKHFPSTTMRQTIHFIKDHYGTFPLDCKEYDRIYELMTHDKKNADGKIYCTLLNDIGDVALNEVLDKEHVFEMLDFIREC